MRLHRCFFVPAACLVATAAVAAEIPAKALKYHEVLLKRPQNAALFERFFGAWIDEQPVEALGEFLEKQASDHGGAHWSVLASYQLRRGNEEAAMAALGEAIAAAPDDLALPMVRGKLRLRRLELAAAREDFALVADGADEALALEASKLAGKAWLREGKTAEAIGAWDAVLAKHPADEDLLEDLVETAAAESEIPQALIYAEKLIAASRDPYQKTLRQLRRADLLSRAGRDDDAVDACAETLAQVGDGSWLEREVLAQIDKILRKQDRLPDLAERLKSLAETYPQRLAIHRQLAKLEAAQGQVDQAIGRFREVLKRTPGERELREEFVRLLTDAERFDDAATELGKLIELAPADANLQFQLAALRSRQGQPDDVAAALESARTLLGGDEAAGLRVAGLFLQYGLAEKGETLLQSLAAAPGASPAALEALAGHYGRTNRKDQAVKLLQQLARTGEIDVLLRAAGAISALGESAVAYDTLAGRAAKFPAEPRFLAAISQAALAAGKPADAVAPALKLVRLATQATELADAILLATRAAAAADQSATVRDALAAQATRTAAETCLLAALAEAANDFVAVGNLLETNADPLVVRFHAALLSRRGDAAGAIAVLTRLADTPDGQKAAYFKDLSDLQQRAGQSAAALATVERWKLAAPGDKSAWLTASNLLRDTGKLSDAVQTMRQAVGRFEDDNDLAAQLAVLHDQAGQTTEAEAIYWNLYDAAQAPADQARWAAQLAQLAQRTATTATLEEKLRERAHQNRRALGPILALAELARVTQDDDKRRDLMLEAVRLQPKDIDLRLQIANLEEQAGNPERVIAVLQDALPFDVDNRVRSALAQAYLRQGEALKGMRELRLLAGKTGFDPRSAEAAAAALAGTKLYEEAITLLRTELQSGGDWRSRYLMAVLMEEDGRETEAIPVFLDLLQAQGELSDAAPPPATPSGRSMRPSDLPPAAVEIQRLMEVQNMAYAHRASTSSRYYGSYGSPVAMPVGNFYLPIAAEDVRQFALVHLANLSQKMPEQAVESLTERVKAAGTPHWDFIRSMQGAMQANERQGVLRALTANLDAPGVFDWFIRNGGTSAQQGMDEAAIRTALTEVKDISPLGRYIGWFTLARTAPADDPAWLHLWTAADAALADNSAANAGAVGMSLMHFLQGDDVECPEEQLTAVKQRMKASFAAMVAERPELDYMDMGLRVAALTGTPDEWLAKLNASIEQFRKNPPPAGQYGGRTRVGQMMQPLSSYRGRSGFDPFEAGDLFAVPKWQELPSRSLPSGLLNIFVTQDGEDEDRRNPAPFTAAELVKRADDLQSPYLRAWLAAKTGDHDALAKALPVPAAETYDMLVLRGVLALHEKKPVEAFDRLLEARAITGPDREISAWTNLALLAAAEALGEEERSARATDIQAAFLQLRQDFGVVGAPVLAAQARKLGFEELAGRLDLAKPAAAAGRAGGSAATGPASIAVAQPAGGSSGNSGTRIQKFVADKKYEAAAREVLQEIRGQQQQRLSFYRRHELPRSLEILGKEGQAELLKLVDPGESKSLVRRLEFVDMAAALRKPELALATLEALAEERPDDSDIAARLVFALPPEQAERQVELLTTACLADEFVVQAAAFGEFLDERDENVAADALFEVVTRWLETVDPAVIAKANLTWVAYYGKKYFQGELSDSYSLFDELKLEDEKKEVVEKRAAIARRLATAMARHAGVVEEGFRLLAASKAWTMAPAELDQLARAVLLAVATQEIPRQSQGSETTAFRMRVGSSHSSSGNDLPEFSSAAWLGRRLGEVESPTEVLPTEFLAELQQVSPEIGQWIQTLKSEVKPADLETLWNSPLVTAADSPVAAMLRPLIIKRIAATPDGVQFFLDRIAAIAPGTAVPKNGDSNKEQEVVTLFSAAIISAADAEQAAMDAVATAISRAVFGEKVDLSASQNDYTSYRRVNFMDSLINRLDREPVAVVRLQNSLVQLGVPSGNGEYRILQPFRNQRMASIPEAIDFLASLGWLADADEWRPFAMVAYDTQSRGNSIAITTEPKLLLDQATNYLRNYGGVDRGDLVKALEERKEGRFGALMVAAALASDEKVRSKLAGQAFSENAEMLAKLPPERVATLAMVLPWLDQEAREKLPDAFRNKAREIDAQLREAAVKGADEFLAQIATADLRNSVQQLPNQVSLLIPYDLDKAVEVFVAFEQTYTDSLARGGQFSSSTRNDWQVAERDEQLGRIWGNDTKFVGAADLRLRFLAKVLASPAGKRLTFNDPSYSDRSMFHSAMAQLLAGDMSRDAPNTEERVLKRIAAMVDVYQAVEPSLQPLALACLVMNDTRSSSGYNIQDQTKLLTEVEKLGAGDPQAAKLAHVVLAVIAWNGSSVEQKQAARTLFAELLADPANPEIVRLWLAAAILSKIPANELMDDGFAEALDELYAESMAGERSAVIPLSGQLFTFLTRKPVLDEAVRPVYANMAAAFWDNALAVRAAGHAAIPNELAQVVFMASLFGGDAALVEKTFPQIRLGMTGSLDAMIQLLQVGRFDLAKQIAPPGDQPFSRQATNTYDRKLEQAVATFGGDGAEPLTLLKLELELAAFPLGLNDDAPVETNAERVARLAAALTAIQPPDIVVPVGLDGLFALAPEDPQLLPLLMEWAKNHPYEEQERTRNVGGFQQSRIRQAAVRLQGRATMHALALGDVEPLRALIAVLDLPRSRNNNRIYYLSNDFEQMFRVMPLVLFHDVAAGRTAGYDAGFPVWVDFVGNLNQLEDLSSWIPVRSLECTEFLSRWVGKPEAFTAVLESLPKQAAGRAKQVKSDRLFEPLLESITQNDPASLIAGSMQKFLAHALVRPGFADGYAKRIGWVAKLRGLAGGKYASAVDAVALDLSENTVQEALPELHEQAGELKREKDPEGAVAEFRAALENTPAGEQWNATRGVMKWKLADLMLTEGRKDEAKEMFGTIPPDEIADWLKDRYENLAKKLDAPPEN